MNDANDKNQTNGARRSEHFAAETLAAYHAGSLPNVESERVQSHLVECRECTANLLEFAAFAEDVQAQTAPPRGELDAEFLKLRERLPFNSAADKAAVEPATAKTIAKTKKLFWNNPFQSFGFAPAAFAAVAVAAALALVALILLRGGRQSNDLARVASPKTSSNAGTERVPTPAPKQSATPAQTQNPPSENANAANRQPLPATQSNQKSASTQNANRAKPNQPNLKKTANSSGAPPLPSPVNPREFVAQLFPIEDLRGEPDAPQTVKIQSNADKIVLRLLPNVEVKRQNVYRWQLRETGGAATVRSGTARVRADKTFSIPVARGGLRAGKYTLELFADAAEKPLQRFAFEIEYR